MWTSLADAVQFFAGKKGAGKPAQYSPHARYRPTAGNLAKVIISPKWALKNNLGKNSST
jgi:hypothetical protein